MVIAGVLWGIFIEGSLISFIRGWRNWLREDPLVRPERWLRPDLVPLAPFMQCKAHLSPGVSGVLAGPAGIYEEFRKAWRPFWCC